MAKKTVDPYFKEYELNLRHDYDCNMPQEIQNPRLFYTQMFKYGDYVWICDEERVWPAIIIEDLEKYGKPDDCPMYSKF